jgi:hypothetical protein
VLRMVRFFRLSGCFWRVGEEVEVEIGCAEEWRGLSRVCDPARERMEGVMGIEVDG